MSSPNLLFPTCRPLPPAAILLLASPPHIAQVNLSILYAALSPPSRIVDPDVHWDTQRSVPRRHAKPASSASSQPFPLQAVRPLEERAAAGAGHDAGRQQVSLRLRQQVNAAACRQSASSGSAVLWLDCHSHALVMCHTRPEGCSPNRKLHWKSRSNYRNAAPVRCNMPGHRCEWPIHGTRAPLELR